MILTTEQYAYIAYVTIVAILEVICLIVRDSVLLPK